MSKMGRMLVAFCVSTLLMGILSLEFGCERNYCERFDSKCEVHEIGDGRKLKNATKCGCCDAWMLSLKKDEPCRITEETPIPRSECGSRLSCNSVTKTCQDANTKCMANLKLFEENIGHRELTMGSPKPNCSEVGTYEPTLCKEGLMCKCVDEDGNRIFGEAPYSDKENMNCACSRDFERYVKVGLITRDSQDFLRCMASGDYDGPQCTETHCYCVGRNGELRSAQVLRSNGTSILPCYDQKIHHRNFITPCMQQRMHLQQQIKEAQKKGFEILGVDLPVCDPDGSYAAKQCVDTECYCVDKLNKRYETTGVPRNSDDERNMHYCNCVREKTYLKDIITKSNQFSQYKCMKNGNYLPIQCTTSICFCVDPVDGYQDGNPSLIASRSKLTKCYKKEYESDLNIMWD